MIPSFLQFLTLLHLYHWRTTSYARHVASGDLYSKMDSLIDEFIEVSQRSKRIRYKPFDIECREMSDADAIHLLESFSSFLNKMRPRSTDLQNLRDEMLTEVSRTLFLFSLA